MPFDVGAVLPRLLRWLFDGCARAKAGVLVDEFPRDKPMAVVVARGVEVPGVEDCRTEERDEEEEEEEER